MRAFAEVDGLNGALVALGALADARVVVVLTVPALSDVSGELAERDGGHWLPPITTTFVVGSSSCLPKRRFINVKTWWPFFEMLHDGQAGT